jgi:hypothetical protein
MITSSCQIFAGSFVYAEDALVGKFKILIKFSQITGG